MESNYPIVQLTSGSHVYYARTYNWSSTGVQTGSTPETTNFTLPTGFPKGTYSLVVIANGIASATTTFSYDTTPPTSSISFPAAGYYNAAGWGSGTITGSTSDPNGVVASVQVSIENTTTGKWYNGSAFSSATQQWLSTGGSLSAWTYNIPSSLLANGSSYAVSSQATDNLGDVQSSPTTASFTYDTTPPTIAIGSPSAAITNTGPISYTVTYADAHFNTSTLAPGNITLVSTGSATGTLAVSGSGLTRTVTVSNISGNGSLGIAIAAGTASDLSGNLAPASGPSAMCTVDNTPPTSTINFPTAAYYNAAGWGSGIISGSSADTGGGAVASVQVSIEDTTTGLWFDGSGFNAATQQWLTTGGTLPAWSYSLPSSLLSDGSSYALYSQATDNVGNVQASQSVASFIYDVTPPTIATSSPSAAITNTGPISYTVTYADANFNTSTLAPGNITLVSTGSATGTLAVSGSGLTRTVTVSNISGNGSLGIAIAAGTASDMAGNLAPASGPSTTCTVDNTPPTSTIGFPTAAYYNAAGWGSGIISGSSADTGGGAVASVQVSIEDATTGLWFDGTGFNAATQQWLTSGGSVLTWTYNLPSSLLSDGSSYALYSQATDNVGNVQASPVATTSFTYDVTPPTIAIGAPSAAITNTGPISYTVTYADANFNTSTLAPGNITLDATGSATGTLAVNGSGLTRTVTVSNISGNGSLGIAIAAGTASDMAGNLAPASGPSTTCTVDNTPPTSTIGFPTAAYYNAAGWGSGIISGSSADTGGGAVASVQVSIEDATTGLWFDGSGFNAATQQWLTSSGTLPAWSYSLPSSLLSDGSSYALYSQATDNVGNVQASPVATTSFTYDVTPPTIAIGIPRLRSPTPARSAIR